eukprot:10936717-Karenia_brevis.AAC.1
MSWGDRCNCAQAFRYAMCQPDGCCIVALIRATCFGILILRPRQRTLTYTGNHRCSLEWFSIIRVSA